MRSWLPPDHLAWQVLGLVRGLDLSEFTAAYRTDGQGQAPYDPQMMLALVFYCYHKGIRPSRKISAACVDDVGCRVICGGAVPSHKTIAEFLKRHRPALKRLFVQVLTVMAAEGAVEGRVAAVDGSPVSGNASRFANLTGEQLDRRIAELEDAIDAAAAAWLEGTAAHEDAADTQERLFDDDDDDDSAGGWPRKLTAMTGKLGRLRAARGTLASRAGTAAQSARSPQARAAAAAQAAAEAEQALAEAEAAQAVTMEKYSELLAAGKRWRGKAPVAPDKNKRIAGIRDRARKTRARQAAADAVVAALAPGKVNGTDPGTRLMPAKNGGFLQGWNIQAAAARRQVLLALEIHDSPADSGAALITMIETATANCDAAGLHEQIRAWLADNGYASAATFKALDHLMLLVSVSSEAAQAGRSQDGGRARLPAGWQPMASRLATPAGKKLYRRRAALVEPAFAQLSGRFGRYLNYRGTDAADAELKLLGTVHNIAKLLQHRRRQGRKQLVPAAA
jgi:transposase